MHTCSSGKCHTGIYHQDSGHTIGNKHHHHFPPPQWLPPLVRHMRPRSIGLIPSLLAKTKMSKVGQNTHMAMQVRCRACPNIADNPPLPQPCKEVLHPCKIEAMDIVILPVIFPTNIRHSSGQAALIGAVMRIYFKIKKLPMCSRRTTLIPNHNIRGGCRHKVTYPYYISKIAHSHSYLITIACILMGMLLYEIREVGIMVVRRKSTNKAQNTIVPQQTP